MLIDADGTKKDVYSRTTWGEGERSRAERDRK